MSLHAIRPSFAMESRHLPAQKAGLCLDAIILLCVLMSMLLNPNEICPT